MGSYITGIVGSYCSSSSKVIAQFGNIYPLPEVSGTSTSAQLSNFAAFTRTCPSDADQGDILSNFITNKLLIQDIFVIYQMGNIYSEGLFRNFEAR